MNQLREFTNLVGVFSRVFPVAVCRVRGTPGATAVVSYYGERYTVVGTDPKSGSRTYAFRVFLA